MGRIKKVATERHTATASPFISRFVQEATSTPLCQLPAKLDSFPQQWPFPRGDLYHWIPLLDRFDHIFELFNQEYALDKGPQQQPIESRILQKGDAEDGMPYPEVSATQEELDAAGLTIEGDQHLIEHIVHFTRILLEHCGNRSLYNSSRHLDALLNTTSLSLCEEVLRLGVRLAQRYQVARYKSNTPHQQQQLLNSHYHFHFDRLQKIANPFPKPPQTAAGTAVAVGKSKEKASQATTYNPSDLVAIAKEPSATAAKGNLVSVHLTYYDQATSSANDVAKESNEAAPVTPTPVRRTSALGPARDRPSMSERSVTTGDVSSTPVKTREADPASNAPKTFQISAAKLADTPTWTLVKEAVAQVPEQSWDELLSKIRVAKAFLTPEDSCQQLLEVRLLAITNLAYALGESKFLEKIGLADSEEPKRFHLAQQLCDLLQPPMNGQRALSLELQTCVLLTLEALAKSRHKSPEVSDALQISHNHGLLYYELRRVIATLSDEEHQDSKLELRETQWREATFDLTNTLLQSNTAARHGERMVNAGIMGVLIEALKLRTTRAERFHEKILQFFDSFIHGISSAFQTLAGVKGLDVLTELMSYEVTSSLQNAKNGHGLPEDFRSKVVDYSIPFYQQSTLRQLFKFIVHMFEHNAGTHDRLLRNLIDTPQVLGALRNVIENANTFGSNVWSGAVNIMSSFIHNEPTSFQVVGEAGLVKSLLQTIVPWELHDDMGDATKLEDMPIELDTEHGEIIFPTPSGILPVGETMCDIPTAFGAICLNESGTKLFQASKALLKFMDIFVSPVHAKAMEDDGSTAANIGQAFDELSRHHPQLKDSIIFTVIAMVKRVNQVCRYLAERKGNGTKLWERTPAGITVSGGRNALAGPFHGSKNNQESSEMVDADSLEEDVSDRLRAMPFISSCFRFLEGFFHNNVMCGMFCEQGGAVHLLDLAASASNPCDMFHSPVFGRITQVVKLMCEARPHLVLPSLIHQTQVAIAELKPMIESQTPDGAFATFADLSKPQLSALPTNTNGTVAAKSLALVHMLTHIFGRALAPPQFAGRHQNQTNQLFTILNFTDVYVELVDNLALLHAACVWENLVLQKNIPDDWKPRTEPSSHNIRLVEAGGITEITNEGSRADNQTNGDSANGSKSSVTDSRDASYAFKNVKTLRYLLSQTPSGIEAFFYSLGQALVPKRPTDPASRQHAAVVAEHMAKAIVREFEYKKFEPADEYTEAKARWHAVTFSTKALLKNSHGVDLGASKEAMTLVLSKFYHANGFEKLNECLKRCVESLPRVDDGNPLVQCHRETLTHILAFYNQVTRSKTITESAQSSHISVKNHEQADYFMPGQFVVEIRDAVLPTLSDLWHSDILENLADSPVEVIIDTLRVILKAEGEDRAITRSQSATRRVQTSTRLDFRQLRNAEGIRTLTSCGYDEQLAREAMFRCNGLEAHAMQYCFLREICKDAPSFPLPKNDLPFPTASTATQTENPAAENRAPLSSEAEASPGRQSIEMANTTATSTERMGGAALVEEGPAALTSENSDIMSDDDGLRTNQSFLETVLGANLSPEDPATITGIQGSQSIIDFLGGSSGQSSATSVIKETRQPFVTLEDLDEKRQTAQKDLLDRCLEVLSAHPAASYQLSDLLQVAVAMDTNGPGGGIRNDVGSVLVSSLLSLQADEPGTEEGAKIAAYAHLVALIIQDREFFDFTYDELRENFDAFISLVQLGHDQKAENAPWIKMILAIVERILVEDEVPVDITWHAPPPENPLQALPELSVPDPMVSTESRSTLFDALIELLPKVGKNDDLALAVCRVLAILTRKRELAMRMSEKLNMSGLFMMLRQLGGVYEEKLQAAFMMTLRNMVEDETILRQIMRTEIRAVFEARSRQIDTTSYARALYHLVIRDPNLFVQTTGELVEIIKYDGQPHRAQALALKRERPSTVDEKKEIQPEGEAEGSGVQKSVEGGAVDTLKTAEAKPPSVEITDGVIQFLLRELSNYRDVEDKPTASSADAQNATTNGSNGDVQMSDAPTASATNGSSPAADAAGTEKPPAFKPEEHVIYIYRCFLMQCLTELLASYNRTKVEFINFSRKPEAQITTPSKPRSGTLNYLLNALVPVGTLEHRDDVAHRKKQCTSHWATTVLVALCAKTPEKRTPRHMNTVESSEDDSDLMYVRKFVLEHALRAFKDATSSVEPLDQRYSRLLALAELFNRMLSNKPVSSPSGPTTSTPTDLGSSRQLGKLMYEKNFVGALTSAIAELDLNFPNAKRAVKYILGPLKQLTELGVALSQIADLVSSAGDTTEEDEISSATSISDEEENREQTPDLYRNSTLGLFESGGGRDDDSEHDSQDDEDDMYDDGYDDEEGMDYEDGHMPDHDDVVSDEDEEIDGMGEVEGLPGDVEFEMDVVMDGEDDEVETLSEESSDDDDGHDGEDDDDDPDDDDGFNDGDMEEITGDDENASMADPDEDHEWDEDDGALFEAAVGEDGISPHGGPLVQIRQAIGADDGSDRDGVVQIDMGDAHGAYDPDDFLPDEMPPGDDDEDEDEEEIDFENDVVEFEEDDDEEDQQAIWDENWGMNMPTHRGHHHHHHHRRLYGGDMFGMFADHFRSRIGGEFRTSYRNGPNGRGEDDGSNPLLQREGAINRDGDVSSAYLPGRLARRGVLPRGADSLIQDLVSATGHDGAHTINVNIGDLGGHLPPMFAIQHGRHVVDFDPARPSWRDPVPFSRWADANARTHDSSRPGSNFEEARAVDFRPFPTTSRWQEAARILFGKFHVERASRIVNSLLRLLVPPAMEAKLQQEKAEAERKAAEEKAREEERKKAEAEQAEREAREKEEREAREAEEARAREEAEREAAANGNVAAEEGDASTMEGVEQSSSTEQAAMDTAPAAPPVPTERVTITIQGSEVDITNLGIDRATLEELPEEFRFEALMGMVAAQRDQAASTGQALAEIDQDFLAALPPDRRHELLRHEVTDRRRREHEATRHRVSQDINAEPAQPEEMNNADFMAMLDPHLRQAILLDADENTLAALPEDIQAEARNLMGDRRLPRPEQIGRLSRFADIMDRERAERAMMREASRQRRPVAQMLDKAGIATLLRLMFVSLHQRAKNNLHGILSDVCKNTQNRAEVISILLSILQDGTADVAAVERSFAHLSLRAKQLSGPKTPTPLKRTATGTVITPGAELSPLNIVQQCLGTLHALAEHNKSVANFFLNAHETLASQKTKSAKKGKGRDTKSSRFPLNSLLTLLDRKLITENTGVMEALASLLSRITAPLLKKASREAEDATQATAESDAQAQDDQAGPSNSDVQMTGAETTGLQPAEPAPAAASVAASNSNEAEPKDAEPQTLEGSKDGDKKPQETMPPDVPEENIRLVVNIITARECPGKTFTETLNVIKHLSTIPGAKEVFGKELVSQAQDLSQAVLVDLEDLLKQINAAQTGTDLQGVALANFSTAASMQHKLLRVLVALDHLFDPKQAAEAPSSTETAVAEPKLKGDILAGLYESSNFEHLWANLSHCLTAIRKRGNMVNVAAILLPLIESLMVVCRNSSLKDIPVPDIAAVGTPPPEARLDSLFFKFTEEHRKILNELIRNNPKLMNGNLAVLAKNSKVLEFDNKRNYFTRKLHTRSANEGRVPHTPLQLSVRRNMVFVDSFKSLYYKSGDEIKYGKLNIRFHNEEGIDAGGVSREWFAAMARQMFNPDYALFIPVASDKTTFHPNQFSAVNDQHLMYFKFIGRIIGKAMYEGRVLDCHFSRAVYRRILGKSVSLKDMESLDLDYYKSLVWILENDITDITFETFSVEVDKFGLAETVDLVPDGRNIAVTEDNKQEYVRLVVEHRLIKSVEEQLENFLTGFHDIIPPELISIFNEQELELLISGLPEIDVDDWKNNTEYHNYQASSPQIQWFWRAVRGFDKEEKAKLLQFVTGTSKVPLNGFKELEGMNGFSKFNIHRDYSSKEKLPSSHTCFNQLDLPEYESYEHLRQQLYTAITAGSEYFGFA